MTWAKGLAWQNNKHFSFIYNHSILRLRLQFSHRSSHEDGQNLEMKIPTPENESLVAQTRQPYSGRVILPESWLEVTSSTPTTQAGLPAFVRDKVELK